MSRDKSNGLWFCIYSCVGPAGRKMVHAARRLATPGLEPGISLEPVMWSIQQMLRGKYLVYEL